ncbi:MAG: hypothetical protein N4A44_03940 [Alphaproteobacteria bacterium]|jgi:hypothetical protein|nr:hypothetical protein [Alphaproteobacteria bacterium]
MKNLLAMLFAIVAITMTTTKVNAQDVADADEWKVYFGAGITAATNNTDREDYYKSTLLNAEFTYEKIQGASFGIRGIFAPPGEKELEIEGINAAGVLKLGYNSLLSDGDDLKINLGIAGYGGYGEVISRSIVSHDVLYGGEVSLNLYFKGIKLTGGYELLSGENVTYWGPKVGISIRFGGN